MTLPVLTCKTVTFVAVPPWMVMSPRNVLLVLSDDNTVSGVACAQIAGQAAVGDGDVAGAGNLAGEGGAVAGAGLQRDALIQRNRAAERAANQSDDGFTAVVPNVTVPVPLLATTIGRARVMLAAVPAVPSTGPWRSHRCRSHSALRCRFPKRWRSARRCFPAKWWCRPRRSWSWWRRWSGSTCPTSPAKWCRRSRRCPQRCRRCPSR